MICRNDNNVLFDKSLLDNVDPQNLQQWFPQQSGISIHFVTEEYDEGKIIFQAETKIDDGETIESLEKKIHQLEHQYYPVIIEKLVTQ